MKKIAGDIFILHICNQNHNHMIYSSSNMEWHRQNILSFWTIFCPFTPLTTWKINILKKWKKQLEMSTFDTYVQKITIIWYMLPDIWSAKDRIFSNFRPFFALLPLPSTSSQPRKSKFWKNEKITWIYYHFTHVHHKWPSYNAWFLRYGAQKTELFVILNHFLQFYPSKNLLNQNF